MLGRALVPASAVVLLAFVATIASACSSAKEVQPEQSVPLPPRPIDDDSGTSGSSGNPTPNDGGPTSPEDAGDAAADAGFGCRGAVDCERVVFVTRGTFVAAAIGGVTGADAKCQAAADTSNIARIKGHTFLAWISAGAITPTARFAHGTKPYIRGDNQLVANNWADLTDGSLKNGIGRDELGAGTDNYAWTGTQTNGTAGALTCTGWTVTSGGGLRGNVGGDGDGWTESQNVACTDANHIYCFEE